MAKASNNLILIPILLFKTLNDRIGAQVSVYICVCVYVAGTQLGNRTMEFEIHKVSNKNMYCN